MNHTKGPYKGWFNEETNKRIMSETTTDTIHLGIDPDSVKSGYAIWDGKELELYTLSFFDLIKELSLKHMRYPNIFVVIEAGHLITKSNWHKEQGPGTRERIAKNVGMCHQVGILLGEFCEKNGIDYEFQIPSSQKHDHEQFCKITGYKGGSTNPEKRDAGLLVYGR